MSPVNVIATLIFVATVLWGVWLCLQILYGAFGAIGVILGLLMFPLTITLVPWYAIITLGNPLPLLLCYGGAVAGWAVVSYAGDVVKLLRGD